MTAARMIPGGNSYDRGRWVRYRTHCLYPGPAILNPDDDLAYREQVGRPQLGYRHAVELKRRIRWRLRFMAFDRTAARIGRHL